MTATQIGILVVGGLAGWWVVSFLFDRRKPPADGSQPSAPRATPGSSSYPASPPPRAPAPTSAPVPTPAPVSVVAPASAPIADADAPSVGELATSWPQLIGIDRDAAIEQIEAAYASRRRELDAARYAPGADESQRAQAARALRRLDAAYEFVRAARAD